MLVRRSRPSTVLGFYSLSSSLIVHEYLPTDLGKKIPPRLEIPATLLGRLAVDQPHQGQGLRDLLLYNALSRVHQAAELVGTYAVTVEATDDSAKYYHLNRDFTPFLDSPLHLFYPVSAIRKLNFPPHS